jgi:hypothetical protein
VQDSERKHVTQAVVATTYGGIVGKFLDATTETLPGYTPVVTAPVEVAGAPHINPDDIGGSQPQGGTAPSADGSSSTIGLQVLGNNPSISPLHASYSDLGAVLLDPYNTNVGVYIYMDGHEVQSPSIDTSTSTSYAIEYHATDPSGNTIMVRRIILVGGAADPGGEINTAGTQMSTPPAVQGIPASEDTTVPPAPVDTPEATTDSTSSPQATP